MGNLKSELIRKAVHVSMGGFALLLRWLTPLEAAACAVVAIAFNVVLLHRLTRRALLRDGERERGWSLGIGLYPVAVLALIVVFRDRLELAAAGWALIAFGDGMAAVTGVLLRGPRLPWNSGKTWSGFAAFVVYGGLGSALLIRWVQKGALGGDGGTPVDWIGASFLAPDPVVSDTAFLVAGCFAAAMAAAFAESVRTGIDDNILVPLIGGTVLWAGASLVDPAAVAERGDLLLSRFLWGAGVNAALAAGAMAARSVALSGAIAGWVLGTLLWTFAGWPGFAVLVAFFVLGSTCTKIGWARKAALGIAQEREGKRGAKNAIANVTAGVAFAFLAFATPHAAWFSLALVAAFATAAADTVSSEVGQAYGRTTYLVTTFRRVRPGTDGAVSLEGTLAGVAASLLLALAGWAVGLIVLSGVAVVAVAALAGTTLESYLGAAFERASSIDNEVMNFTNTVAGGLIAIGLYALLR